MSELIKQEQASPNQLIQMAISQNADIDKLERLMDMQIKWDASQAQKKYFEALSKFQELCPVITKNKQGHNYKYAPLSDIVQQIKQSLQQVGISYRFEQTTSEQGAIIITCVTTHVDGHSERTSMSASPDTSGSKNSVQAIGSTVSYLQRYTLTGSLGIATADDDMDGRLPTDIDWKSEYEKVLTHVEAARNYIDEVFNIKEAIANGEHVSAKQEFVDLDQDIQKALWKAPSKGGIFTTEELKSLKETSATGAAA